MLVREGGQLVAVTSSVSMPVGGQACQLIQPVFVTNNYLGSAANWHCDNDKVLVRSEGPGGVTQVSCVPHGHRLPPGSKTKTVCGR